MADDTQITGSVAEEKDIPLFTDEFQAVIDEELEKINSDPDLQEEEKNTMAYLTVLHLVFGEEVVKDMTDQLQVIYDLQEDLQIAQDPDWKEQKKREILDEAKKIYNEAKEYMVQQVAEYNQSASKIVKECLDGIEKNKKDIENEKINTIRAKLLHS